MDYNKLIISIGLLFFIGYFYDKYKSNLETDKEFEDFQIVRKYLLGESKEISNLRNSNKPILWIHINYEKNSRDWDSFLSRSSNDLNLPYYYFTLRSIISKNSNDFNICIIDDNTICKLLEQHEFNFDLGNISEPRKKNVRLLALSKLVYKYGGLVIPPSFICFQSLKNLTNITDNNVLLFGENKNESVSFNSYPFIPSYEIFGSNKENKELNNFIDYIENLVNKEYTNENFFIGNINNYLLNKLRKNDIAIITAEYLGLKTNKNKEITIEDLFGNALIEFNDNAYGMLINNCNILKRHAYNWFCYLSINEILDSNFILAKYLINNCQ